MCGQHALFLGNLIDGFDALEGFQGHADLELGNVCSCCSFYWFGGGFYHPGPLCFIAYTLAPFCGTASERLAQVGRQDVELLAVLRDRPARHLDALLGERLRQRFV